MTSLEATVVHAVHGSRHVLDGVTVTFRPSEVVGLVGPNGAGKTTLLKHLAGLRRPASGSITLDGRHVSNIAVAERGWTIGYVPQHFGPAWDLTVGDLVHLGASRARHRAVDVARALSDQNLESLTDRRWSRLSGGERARALLAAVLVAEPAVVLADEPGAGLDVSHRRRLLDGFRTMAVGRIVVVVMHDLEAAIRQCDRLVVMANGRIALDGAPASVVDSPLLDAAFGVSFQRVPVKSEAGPMLPLIRPDSGPRA